MKHSRSYPHAVVLGLFETALCPIRSLGRLGLRVAALDTAPLCAVHSRYAQSMLCPSPSERPAEFVSFLKELAANAQEKPVLFVTGDQFLVPVAEHRAELEKYYLLNLPTVELLREITDKLIFYHRMQQGGIACPRTLEVDGEGRRDLLDTLSYPAFVKARDVLLWRKALGPSKKGFAVRDRKELLEVLSNRVLKGVPVIVQELIPGPDTNHWKFCGYVSKQGEMLCEFTLQKIRQQPVHFGIGSCVEGRYNRDVLQLGRRLFHLLDYRGVGSVEFKFDRRDRLYKVIELNPRFWQQNALAAASGQDFGLAQYNDLRGRASRRQIRFTQGVRWVNLHRDWEAYRSYQEEGLLNISRWLLSLRAPLIISDFAWDDPLPLLLTIHIGRRVRKAGSLIVDLFKAVLQKTVHVFAPKSEQYP